MILTSAIDQLLLRGGPVLLVALDGRCATGKTTLAAQLEARYDCAVFHMDDFFLRPDQRTPERLAQPGGNVDYERFLSEVLTPLRAGGPVRYRPWRCQTQSFGELRQPAPARLNLIEGAYSLHPALRTFYDLRVVLTAPLETRLSRLRVREGDNFPNYLTRWIPLEDRYFEQTGAMACADLTVDTL